MSNSPGLSGLIVAMINRKRINNSLRKIEEENIENQGISRYLPSNIEAFFDENEPIGNLVLSGGINGIRCKAIARSIECAYFQGYSAVILHTADQELDNYLVSVFGQQNINQVNRGNPIYDPFYNRTNEEIDRLVLSSGIKGAEVGPVGKYYLDAISEFIRAKGIIPYLDMYFTCPHMQLIDKINEQEQKGRITESAAQALLSKLIQGESERGNVEAFFGRLFHQAGGVTPKKQQLQYSINVNTSIARNQVLSVDVQNSANSILINLLINEIEMELETGRKMMLIIDNLPLASSDILGGLVKKSGANCAILMTSDDVYSMFGGDDNLFYSFLGKCSKAVLSKHSSGFSSQKWSDYIGTYDKKEVTGTYAENANYLGQWGLGATSATNVNIKRENIVKAEEILRMGVEEVYIVNKNTGEISNTVVI